MLQLVGVKRDVPPAMSLETFRGTTDKLKLAFPKCRDLWPRCCLSIEISAANVSELYRVGRLLILGECFCSSNYIYGGF